VFKSVVTDDAADIIGLHVVEETSQSLDGKFFHGSYQS
jgi:hypothetical protein